MSREALNAWDDMSDTDRRALFAGMYTYLQAADPGVLLVLEVIARQP